MVRSGMQRHVTAECFDRPVASIIMAEIADLKRKWSLEDLVDFEARLHDSVEEGSAAEQSSPAATMDCGVAAAIPQQDVSGASPAPGWVGTIFAGRP